MTTIRRINVSQINGNDANTNNTDEIRPFGETAFYIDQSNENNKLVLSMHDGVRTHLRSKVLGPGVLYGSNADSGDGAGYDTIKLIPDSLLYSQGSEQYLIVDPTTPGHIHLRAGGMIDNSNASLYLGGENSNVLIPSGPNPPVIVTANSSTWTFGTDGGLVFPDSTVQTTAAGGDTLDTITTRGATTTNAINVGSVVTTDIIGKITALTGYNITGVPFPEGAGTPWQYTWVSSGPEVTQLIALGNSLIGARVAQSEFAGTATVIGLPNLGGTLGIEFDAAITYSPTNTLTFTSPDYALPTQLPLDLTVGANTWTFKTNGGLTLPGGASIDASGYDVSIVAGNDGASTFGSVTINTQAPPAVYTVVQQWSPFNLDTISTDASATPYIASIVPGMTVTGAGITATTIVTNVTGPDEYGAFFITVSPASDTGLNYNETYTFTSAGGVTNRNWEFNSLGELYLPQGGAIQETEVTNELWGTTTTSLTLVPAGAANGTQRLEIYSTGGGEGDHIHITSGDQTQTDLFLGNDTQYFAVAATGQNYIQARNGTASPSPGTSAGPGANVNIYAGSAGDNGGNVADGNSGGDIFIASGISSSGLGGDILLNTSSGPDGFGSIELSTDGGSSFWAFNKDNQIVFPDGTVQSTAYTNTMTEIKIGLGAGETFQGTSTVAIGASAGNVGQSDESVAIGNYAGNNNQGFYSVAIGNFAGATLQGNLSVGIGSFAGNNQQGEGAVAIGQNAGRTNQGSGSIAIGWAGETNQPANSIIINASVDSVLNASAPGFYINPLRNTATNVVAFYNTTTKEISYSSRYVDAPVSSTSTGIAGSVAYDASFFYVCTATNSWQRIAWDSNPW